VLKYFDEVAENPPNEIINRLVEKADEWMDMQKQNDDITFVVIRAL
jgi:serine phosphatase RsbU (regulator of sigma subunit)